MWQRFTERARKVVFYAQEEAQKHSHGFVQAEHLLLGCLRDEDAASVKVLNILGVSVQELRREVESRLPPGGANRKDRMTLTPRAKYVIDLAYQEARQLGNNYIGTEHLLLGIARCNHGLSK